MRRMKKVRSVRTCLPSQREVLRDVLLSATECGSWLTLRELSQLTQYGEASISAQLRHLRKTKYGSYVIEKRVRRDLIVRDAEHGAIWEYLLAKKAAVCVHRDRKSTRLNSSHFQVSRMPSSA